MSVFEIIIVCAVVSAVSGAAAGFFFSGNCDK